MSPKIEIQPRNSGTERWTGLLVDSPDKNGSYKVEQSQENIEVDMNPPESTEEQPVIAIKSNIFRGHERDPLVGDPYYGNERRTIFLNEDGRGAQCLTTDTKIVVQLHE